MENQTAMDVLLGDILLSVEALFKTRENLYTKSILDKPSALIAFASEYRRRCDQAALLAILQQINTSLQNLDKDKKK